MTTKRYFSVRKGKSAAHYMEERYFDSSFHAFRVLLEIHVFDPEQIKKAKLWIEKVLKGENNG